MHKIYFIDSGMVNIYKDGNLCKTLHEGDFFGIETILKNNDENKFFEYIVSEECTYAIFYTIDIPFLVDEILNYDEESFKGIVYLASYFIKTVLNRGNDEDNNILNYVLNYRQIPSFQNQDLSYQSSNSFH